MSVVVRYAHVPVADIVDLTSPRYLPEVSRSWPGRLPWHDERYEPVRDLMERMYIDGFNEATGHYRLLLESMRDQGLRNPVMLVAGGVQRRSMDEVPPHLRAPDIIVSEYLGGSRIWAARQLGMATIPAIVNDLAGVLPDAEVLPDRVAVLAKFTDAPRTFRMSGTGVELNDLPYMHIPEHRRYEVSEQSRTRRGIIDGIQREIVQWLKEHDT